MNQQLRKRQAAEPDRSKQTTMPSSASRAHRSGRAAGAQAASNQLLQRLLVERAIQPKLTVNEPDDKYEREADRAAEAVMRMPDPTPVVNTEESRGPDRIQRMCSRCRRRRRLGKPLDCPECEQQLQRKETSARPPAVDGGLERQLQAMRGDGAQLPASMRSFFESRFSRDFSGVRVHTGHRADRAARLVNAEAFTLGSDVVFRSGAYRPGSQEGSRLLAHELAHVVQQGAAPFQDQDSDVAARHEVPSIRRSLDPSAAARQVQRRVEVDEPAAGCGVCYSQKTPDKYLGSGLGPRDVGQVAHRLIQDEFADVSDFVHAELPFSSPTDENGRLDLFFVPPSESDTVRIGEIKPANPDGYDRGSSDIDFYEGALSSALSGTNVERMTRKLQSPLNVFPNPNAKSCPVQLLWVNPPEDGVYGYYCSPPWSELRSECDCRDEEDDDRKFHCTNLGDTDTVERFIGHATEPVTEALRRRLEELQVSLFRSINDLSLEEAIEDLVSLLPSTLATIVDKDDVRRMIQREVGDPTVALQGATSVFVTRLLKRTQERLEENLEQYLHRSLERLCQGAAVVTVAALVEAFLRDLQHYLGEVVRDVMRHSAAELARQAVATVIQALAPHVRDLFIALVIVAAVVVVAKVLVAVSLKAVAIAVVGTIAYYFSVAFA